MLHYLLFAGCGGAVRSASAHGEVRLITRTVGRSGRDTRGGDDSSARPRALHFVFALLLRRSVMLTYLLKPR